MKKKKVKRVDQDPVMFLANRIADDVFEQQINLTYTQQQIAAGAIKLLRDPERLNAMNSAAYTDAVNDCISEEIDPVQIGEPLDILSDAFVFEFNEPEDIKEHIPLVTYLEEVMQNAMRDTYFSLSLDYEEDE